MDFVFWIILIVLIVGVVWWLLNRGSSTKATGDDGRAAAGPADIRADGALSGGSAAASAEAAGTAGIATAAGFGRPAEPLPPTTADDALVPAEPSDAGRDAEPVSSAPERSEAEPETASAAATAAQPPVAGNAEDETAAPAPRDADDTAAIRDADAVQGPQAAQGTGAARGINDQVEWETQWSEAGGSPAPHAAATAAAPAGSAATDTANANKAGQTALAHRPEYTGPHSPTLPGAESAAAEVVLDEPAAAEPAESSPVEPSTAGPSPVDIESVPEPTGHLAADRPYGEGSASPSPDGSGPADFTVKGDADSMVYYEEGHPEYEQTRAGVWFESAAHAEAAGFRAPRRTRLQ